MQGILLQIGHFESGLSKSLKKFTFLSNRLSSACHSHVSVHDAYVTRMYLYVIRMSLVCTRMSSVCRSYVLVYHPYVTRMWFYHGPQIIGQLTMIVLELFTTCIHNLLTDHLLLTDLQKT